MALLLSLNALVVVKINFGYTTKMHFLNQKNNFQISKKKQDMSFVINGLKGEFEQHYKKYKSSMIPKDKSMIVITSDGKIHKIDLEKFWEKILSPRE